MHVGVGVLDIAVAIAIDIIAGYHDTPYQRRKEHLWVWILDA